MYPKKVESVKSLFVYGKHYHTARTAAERWAHSVLVRKYERHRAKIGLARDVEWEYSDHIRGAYDKALRRSLPIFRAFFSTKTK